MTEILIRCNDCGATIWSRGQRFNDQWKQGHAVICPGGKNDE